MPTETAAPRKPVNHGFLTPQKTPELPPVWLPPELRGKKLFNWGLDAEEAAAAYGLWPIEITSENEWIYGKLVHRGDEVKVPGNVAVFLINRREAVALDARRGKEEELYRKAHELGIPMNDRDNPAFQELQRELREADNLKIRKSSRAN
jgi:hypothetical protein